MWWRKLGEVENECTSHHFSLFASFLAEIIKIGGNLTEVLAKTILHSFLRHGVYVILEMSLSSRLMHWYWQPNSQQSTEKPSPNTNWPYLRKQKQTQNLNQPALIHCNNCSFEYAQLWYTVRHRTVLKIFPLILQKIITAQMLFIAADGEITINKNSFCCRSVTFCVLGLNKYAITNTLTVITSARRNCNHICPSVCLPACQQDYAKHSRAFFVKRCRNMDFCYGKNRLNFGVHPNQMAKW